MRVIDTAILELKIIEPEVFGDDRGFFLESWNRRAFADLGLSVDFDQDNHSRSARSVLRGMHYQNPNPQGKLIRVVTGRVWDVAVDIRRSSPTFGKWVGVELSAANKRMFWVPPGFAHGFLSLEDADLLYKCVGHYDPAHEHSLLWNDPDVAVDWPLDGIEPKLSARDRAGLPWSRIEPFA